MCPCFSWVSCTLQVRSKALINFTLNTGDRNGGAVCLGSGGANVWPHFYTAPQCHVSRNPSFRISSFAWTLLHGCVGITQAAFACQLVCLTQSPGKGWDFPPSFLSVWNGALVSGVCRAENLMCIRKRKMAPHRTDVCKFSSSGQRGAGEK